MDLDEPAEGHHFYFSMVAEKHINPNFTIRDNQGQSRMFASLSGRKGATITLQEHM